MKFLLFVLPFVLLLAGVVGCDLARSTLIVTPTPASNALSTRVADAVAATLTAAAPAAQSTAIPGTVFTPTSPSTAAETPSPGPSTSTTSTPITVTVTPVVLPPLPPVTLMPGTPPPTPTATLFGMPSLGSPPLPPGVYVLDVRLDPPQPKNKQDIWFNVMFLNSTGVEQTYRWFIFIYRSDHRDPFGQTSSDRRGDGQDVLPPGISQRKSLNAWGVWMGDIECTGYWAKVHFLDLNSGERPVLLGTDGREFVKRFQVCPEL